MPLPSPTALVRIAIASLALLGAVSCSCSKEPVTSSPAPGGREAREAPAPPAELRSIDPASTGRVRGVATFAGEPPERQPLATGGAAGCHVEDDAAPLSERVIVEDGRLANVFVFVDEGLDGWALPAPPEAPVTLDQHGCTYVPHVTGVQIGQTLRVLNSDETTHNIHSRSRRNSSFNRTQAPGRALELVFDRAEVFVPIVCDLHPWMKCFVGVVEHPFFAVTAADGSFAIEGLPPGTYTLDVRHEAYEPREVEFTIEAGGESVVELAFP